MSDVGSPVAVPYTNPNRHHSAVISVKKGGSKGGSNVRDVAHVFRSYNLQWRKDNEITEARGGKEWLNPGPAFDGSIWQACRATTAAPTFFKNFKIDDSRYMDGGTKVSPFLGKLCMRMREVLTYLAQ